MRCVLLHPTLAASVPPGTILGPCRAGEQEVDVLREWAHLRSVMSFQVPTTLYHTPAAAAAAAIAGAGAGAAGGERPDASGYAHGRARAQCVALWNSSSLYHTNGSLHDDVDGDSDGDGDARRHAAEPLEVMWYLEIVAESCSSVRFAKVRCTPGTTLHASHASVRRQMLLHGGGRRAHGLSICLPEHQTVLLTCLPCMCLCSRAR